MRSFCKRRSCFRIGLEDIRVGELVEFVDKQVYGMALNLEREQVVLLCLVTTLQ